MKRITVASLLVLSLFALAGTAGSASAAWHCLTAKWFGQYDESGPAGAQCQKYLVIPLLFNWDLFETSKGKEIGRDEICALVEAGEASLFDGPSCGSAEEHKGTGEYEIGLPKLTTFVTASGGTLSFHAEGGLSQLFGERLGVVGEIHCEKNLATGEILSGTSLADKVLIDFTGKCVQNSPIGDNEVCVEPILAKQTRGELGETGGLVSFLLAPVSGTEFATTDCGGEGTTVTGAIIGLFTESAKYNKLESSALLLFSAKGTSQQDTEIELLGTSMTGIHLSASGLFGGNAAESASTVITADGDVEIRN